MSEAKAFIIGAVVGITAMAVLVSVSIVGAKDDVIRSGVLHHDGKEYDVIPRVIPCQPHK